MKKNLIVFLIIGLMTLLFVFDQADAKKKKAKKEDKTENIDQDTYQKLLTQLAQMQPAQQEQSDEPEKKPGRKFALGCEGNGVITVRMKLTGFTLDIMGRLELDLSKPENADKGMFDLYAGCRLVKVFVDGKKVRMNIFAGGILESTGSRSDPGGQTNLYLQVGFAPEIFITDAFSVETTAGAQMSIIGDNAGTSGNDGRITLGTYGDNINLNAGIAFHCYF